MISAALGHTEPDHPLCSGALWRLWPLILGGHAFKMVMALSAYSFLPVRYHASAMVYAAIASSLSSEQPRFGFECDPHALSLVSYPSFPPCRDPGYVRRPLSDEEAS